MKEHTEQRRKLMKKAAFARAGLQAKFKMILSRRGRADAGMLFHQLAREEKLEFLHKHYKGVKVKYIMRPRQILGFDPVRLINVGVAIDVFPVVNGITFCLKLADYGKPGPGDEVILKQIQHYLPTVKVL